MHQVQMLSYSDATKTKLLNRPQARGRPLGEVIQLVKYLPGHAGRTWTHNVLLNIHYGDIAV
jgi:hypothetical protein